jgi:hypothetical protein
MLDMDLNDEQEEVATNPGCLGKPETKTREGVKRT